MDGEGAKTGHTSQELAPLVFWGQDAVAAGVWRLPLSHPSETPAQGQGSPEFSSVQLDPTLYRSRSQVHRTASTQTRIVRAGGRLCSWPAGSTSEVPTTPLWV